MSQSFLQYWPLFLVAAAAGSGLGWLLGGLRGRRALEKANHAWLVKFDEAVRQRDRFNAENKQLRAQVETRQALAREYETAVTRLKSELASAGERIAALAAQESALGAERNDLRSKLNKVVCALDLGKRQYAELEDEFAKTGVFYKGELRKSVDKRKLLESKFEDARAEQDSLVTLLDAARSENESLGRMLAAAQSRLENLDALESRSTELETENAKLSHDAATARQTIDALKRDVAELDELKVQNRELAHCLKSMEHSRKQYERDAMRYREQAEKSEKNSATLRTRLDDVEKNFTELAKRQNGTTRIAQVREIGTDTGPEAAANDEMDDLTEIVGIGKVFEEMLHGLGIRSFRQIATLGPVDIARINLELREYRGRIEQDDWIGQARELLHRKHGSAR
jgi:predicted flap endonuclease-1-like 5' DNA nuclease